MSVDVDVVVGRVKEVNGFKRERELRIVTWNFSGLCSECKQREVGELSKMLNLDIVAGKESWEIAVDGYTESLLVIRRVREGKVELAFLSGSIW